MSAAPVRRVGDHRVLVVTLLVSAVSPVAAAVILGLQAVVFAIGALRGPRQHPYGLIFAKLVAPRLGPVTDREPVAAAEIRPTGRLRLRGGRRRRVRHRADRARRDRDAFALVAAFLNAAFGICLGCQLYPLVRPAAAPGNCSGKNRKDFLHGTLRRPGHHRLGREQSRRSQHRLRRGGRGHSAYEGGHIAGAVRLDWKTELQDPVKRDFVDAAAVLEAAVRQGHLQRRHRDPLRRQQQLVRRIRLLVLQAVRPRGRQAARRWPQEVGARRAPAGHRRRERGPTSRTPPRRRTTASARSATRCIAAIGEPRTWSTCAPPTSSRARSWRPRTCRRSRASARGISPAPSTFRGAGRPTRTAPSSPTRTWPSSTPRPGWTASKETIAYCRIGERSSHTWFVLQELLGHKNVKNYDGSWTEYGSLVGAPIELGS